MKTLYERKVLLAKILNKEAPPSNNEELREWVIDSLLNPRLPEDQKSPHGEIRLSNLEVAGKFLKKNNNVHTPIFHLNCKIFLRYKNSFRTRCKKFDHQARH